MEILLIFKILIELRFMFTLTGYWLCYVLAFSSLLSSPPFPFPFPNIVQKEFEISSWRWWFLDLQTKCLNHAAILLWSTVLSDVRESYKIIIHLTTHHWNKYWNCLKIRYISWICSDRTDNPNLPPSPFA